MHALMSANFVYGVVLSFVFQAANDTSSREGFSLIDIINRTGLAARVVAGILAIMSIYSIGVMVERWLTFNAARVQSRRFVVTAAAALRERRFRDAITASEQHRRSHLATVVNAGLNEYLIQRDEPDLPVMADEIRDAVERAKGIKTAELSRGLSGLATVGSTAPFVGLLGTVIGIINAFQSMTINETTGLKTVAGGISEALIETAFGLVVAIPAVWTFNYFTHKLEAFKVEMNNSSSELLVYLKKHRRGRHTIDEQGTE
jgi:biopolymer transport protein ExbB/biopolymer transport protein TolQ